MSKALKAEITLKGYTIGEFLEKTNIKPSRFYRGLKSNCNFRRDEMVRIISILEMNSEKAISIFFDL